MKHCLMCKSVLYLCGVFMNFWKASLFVWYQITVLIETEKPRLLCMPVQGGFLPCMQEGVLLQWVQRIFTWNTGFLSLGFRSSIDSSEEKESAPSCYCTEHHTVHVCYAQLKYTNYSACTHMLDKKGDILPQNIWNNYRQENFKKLPFTLKGDFLIKFFGQLAGHCSLVNEPNSTQWYSIIIYLPFVFRESITGNPPLYNITIFSCIAIIVESLSFTLNCGNSLANFFLKIVSTVPSSLYAEIRKYFNI